MQVALSSTFSSANFTWALGAACQLHRIPFDGALLLKQFPPPHTLESLREALLALGFREAISECPAEELSELPGPSFVTLSPADEGEQGLALLLRHDGGRVLLIHASQTEPSELSAADFTARYAGRCLQFIPAAKTLKPDDETAASTGSSATSNNFGFRWFLPELLKHKPTPMPSPPAMR